MKITLPTVNLSGGTPDGAAAGAFLYMFIFISVPDVGEKQGFTRDKRA
jgi:hypothetical protein